MREAILIPPVNVKKRASFLSSSYKSPIICIRNVTMYVCLHVRALRRYLIHVASKLAHE